MPEELIELARFHSSEEAAIVRGLLDAEGVRAELAGEAANGWLWHIGSALGGVRLLIAKPDAERAREILGDITPLAEMEDVAEEPEHVEEAEVPEDLMRAWRASLIGLFLLPPLLNIYSLWLLARNRFFWDRCRNWRVPMACGINMLPFLFIVFLVMLLTRSEPATRRFIVIDDELVEITGEWEGEPLPVHTKPVRIPIVP